MRRLKGLIVVVVCYGFLSQSFAIDAINLIKCMEGSRKRNDMHVAYICPAGVKTIGYGTTSPAIVGKGRITETEAIKHLTREVDSIGKFIDKKVKVKLSSGQKAVLISLVYNIGRTKFSKSTLLKKLNAGDYKAVAKQIKRWSYAGDTKLAGLTNRRQIEAKLWLKG